MKWSSALSTFQNGIFRKGALRFCFVISILSLERITLKLLTKKYSFISYWYITFRISGLMVSSEEARVAFSWLGIEIAAATIFVVVRSLTPQTRRIVTQLELLKVLVSKQYETGWNILFMIIWWVLVSRVWLPGFWNRDSLNFLFYFEHCKKDLLPRKTLDYTVCSRAFFLDLKELN